MLDELRTRNPKRSGVAFTLSFCLHLLVLASLLYRPSPKILKPEGSLRGDGGGGHVALVAPGYSVLTAPSSPKEEELEPKRTVYRPHPPKKTQPPVQPTLQAATTDKDLKPGMPGYILGSLSSGFILDHDVKVALPVVAPDPPIVRAKLPDWIRGDVIVEVTIDEDGHVTDTVVLKTVGFGLDSVIVDTLRQWHFKPAMVDGLKVASRQDVHFHFPS